MEIDNLVKSFKRLWIFTFVVVASLITATFFIKSPIINTSVSATVLEVMALVVVLLSQLADVFWVKKTLNDPGSDKSDGALLNAYFAGSVISLLMLVTANVLGLIFSNLLNEPLRMIPVTAVSLYLLYKDKPQKDQILNIVEELKKDS